METLKKAVKGVVKVIGIIMGGNFPTAADFLAREYPFLAYGC